MIVLKLILALMRKYLLSHPSADIVDYAKEVMSLYRRELIPDWIDALANGNKKNLDAVIEVAIADMNEGEKEDERHV